MGSPERAPGAIVSNGDVDLELVPHGPAYFRALDAGLWMPRAVEHLEGDRKPSDSLEGGHVTPPPEQDPAAFRTRRRAARAPHPSSPMMPLSTATTPAAMLFHVEDQVRTPTGAVATVMAVYPDVDEVLVQWSSGDRARFKAGHLQLYPPPPDEPPPTPEGG